jgi:hypothetical protein
MPFCIHLQSTTPKSPLPYLSPQQHTKRTCHFAPGSTFAQEHTHSKTHTPTWNTHLPPPLSRINRCSRLAFSSLIPREIASGPTPPPQVSWNVRNNHGGGYAYRLCPATEPLSESCFQKHHLEFVRDKQAILWPNGTTRLTPGTFVSNGTSPRGSTWAMLPIPEAGLGPRCLPGPNDTNSTPNGCQEWEGRNDGHNGHVPGPCVPCPETPGSDCSRCDNGGKDAKSPSFTPPFPGVEGSPLQGILDVVEIPPSLSPGEYVLGWRYDCEATAQVWQNCADVTLVA